MNFADRTTKETLRHLESTEKGLSGREAAKRLHEYGPNEISIRDRGALIRRILAPFRSVFVLILILGAIISYMTGHIPDTIVISVVVVINAIIEWVQQVSAAKVLRSLRKFDIQKITVRRDNTAEHIDSRELVPGDVVLINEGEKIPADGRIIESSELLVDESSLTGESQPISKSPDAVAENTPIYEQTNMLFKGTLVQSGRAVFVITATGNSTEFGSIARLASKGEKRAPIAAKIDRLTYQLIVLTFIAATATIALGLRLSYTFPEMLQFAIALIVSVIPEGLPVTLTVIFLLGMQRMAKKNAFVRNLPAVETLGMVTVVATDKTGTITENQTAIKESWDIDGSLDALDHAMIWLSVSHRHPDLHHQIEKLLTKYSETLRAPGKWKELDDLPFETKRRFTAVAWQKGVEYRVVVKGAPEPVLAVTKLSEADRATIEKQMLDMSHRGMRVIAVASKTSRSKPSLTNYEFKDMEFEGLIGFSDTVREETKAAVAATKRAGIAVYMLTGDHAETGEAVGREVGIIMDASESATGADIENMESNALARLLKKIRVFGRVLPQHKFRILEVLQKQEIVAMTGDGVNDAPALAKANVGIAMGSGTDVAKEAADIILLDDNYSTIVEAIKEGRTIYGNIRKMVFYLLSTNLAEVITIILSLLLQAPGLPVTAVMILWLNLVTDTMMVIPLGLEPAEPNSMHEPPRRPRESLLSNQLAVRLIFTGLAMALSALWVFYTFLPQGLQVAQSMTFLALVIVQWANAFNARSETASIFQTVRRRNNKLWIGLFGGILLQLLVFLGPLRHYMGTVPVSLESLLYLIPPVLVTLAVVELHKLLMRASRS